MRALNYSGRSRWQRLGVIAAAAALTGSGLVLVFALPSSATLIPSPSQFESGDGNMTVDTTSLDTDWNCFATLAVNATCSPTVAGVQFNQANGAAVKIAAPGAGTGSDPSWVPGQKMDQGTCVPGTTSKSPAKDTFTQVASYNETVFTGGDLGDTYLYGATERATANGSASENIELSKVAAVNAPASASCAGGTVIYRSAGDKLIALNYISGGAALATPTILTWVASSSGYTDPNTLLHYLGTCTVSSDHAPCWSSTVISPVAGTFEGRANNLQTILSGNNGIGGDALAIDQFAEFGIDLSSFGIVPAGSCGSFSQETWEARSSGSSFTSNPSDIEVEQHQVSNCGNVTIIKHTDPRTNATPFNFTSTGLTDNSSVGGSCSGIGANGAGQFCLTDDQVYPSGPMAGQPMDGTHDTVSETGVSPGPVTITETSVSGWALESLNCIDAGTGHSVGTIASNMASFNLGPMETVQCTYQNKQPPGAIKITKESTKGATLAGASFSVLDANGHAATTDGGTWEASASNGTATVTGTNGIVCIDNLPLGDYTVIETGTPHGYANSDPSPGTVAHVTASATCSTGTQATTTISDPPLTDITVTVTSEATGGSASKVYSCQDTSSGTSGAWSNSGVNYTGTASAGRVGYLPTTPGGTPFTVTCTVDIDP